MLPMIYLQTLWGSFKRFTETLIGSENELLLEARIINSTQLIAFLIQIIGLLTNTIDGNEYMVMFTICSQFLLIISFYLTRYKKKYIPAFYVILLNAYSFNASIFFFNAGTDGPFLMVFLLTYLILAVISRPRYHVIWALMHASMVIFFLWAEYHYPIVNIHTYHTESARYYDNGLTFLMVLTSFGIMLGYVRTSFFKEKKKADERFDVIQSISSEKDKILSIVSHDIRNPLNNIKQYLEMLVELNLSPEEDKTYRKILLDNANETLSMMENLLSWAKAQMQATTIHLKVCDVNLHIHKIQKELDGIIKSKRIKIVNNIPEGVTVKADEVLLSIVLRNLIHIAVKFSFEGQSVELSYQQTATETQINVHDSGTGIPEAKQNDLFTFKAASSFGTKNEKGLGIGLAICRQYVEMQKGRIHFFSEQNKGAIFTVSLPN